jgi:hypothetical protein
MAALLRPKKQENLRPPPGGSSSSFLMVISNKNFLCSFLSKRFGMVHSDEAS